MCISQGLQHYSFDIEKKFLLEEASTTGNILVGFYFELLKLILKL